MKFAKLWLIVLIVSVLSTTGIVNAQNAKQNEARKADVAQKVDPNHPAEKSMEKSKDLIKTPVSSEVVTKKISKSDLSCRYIYLIMGAMLRQHMLYNQFTKEVEDRTIDQYIKSLDPLKGYLLASDVDKMKKDLGGMEKWLAKQDCSPLDKVQILYTQRVAESSDFAKKYLGKEFKLDHKMTLQMDAQKREYPKNKTELEDFQKRYIQFQVANFVSTDMKEDEAKGWVERRYDRTSKKLREQADADTYASLLDSFARSMDPHSSYLSADDLEDFNIHMNLSLEGIGATLSSQDGYTVIEQLIPGGAAAASAELESQDKIIAVGQGKGEKMEPVVDMPLKDVVKLIRGKKGTTVTLSVLRKTADGMKSMKVTLTRSKINLEDEAAQISYQTKEVNGKKYKIGILNLPSFYYDSKNANGRSCYRDMKRLLKEAQKEKIDGLVLDLSQNGGGSLEDAVKLTGLFIKTGNIVKTQGAKSSTIEVLADQDPEVNYSGPLVVLTSRLSASASEILAGALKDYGRAVIVGGDHTFGKGSVQTVLPLPKNLGAYKVTVGMFFVPGGKSTQHGGVDGDITLPSAFALDEIGEKSLDYSLSPKAIPQFTSEDAYVEKGEGAWAKVDAKVVTELKKKSEERVGKNAEFKKISEELAKLQKKGKLVTLSEILNDKEKKAEEKEKKSKKADAKKRLEEYLKRPDITESVSIVTDYLQLVGPQGVVAQKKGSQEANTN
ncbi:MAG: S41 family peptidase [Bdellovibrionota bacterium]